MQNGLKYNSDLNLIKLNKKCLQYLQEKAYVSEIGLKSPLCRSHLAKLIFEIDAQTRQKCHNGTVTFFVSNSQFGTFFPVLRFQKFFCSNDF